MLRQRWSGRARVALIAAAFCSWSAFNSELARAQCDAAQTAKLTASDQFTGDWFAQRAVAVSGDYAVAGAQFNDDAGTSSGSAYVFVRNAGVWSPQAKLVASDAGTNDQFGISVGISGDTMIVGAENDDDAATNAGAAYVFVRSGTTWSQQAKLIGTGLDTNAMFGHSVGVSGNTAVVGAPQFDAVLINEGGVFVFTRSGTTWTQQTILKGADLNGGERLGMSVAIHADTVVSGATFDDPFGSFSGSAYVFFRNAGVWAQQAKLTASDGAEFDTFGEASAVNGDLVIVGAPQDDDGGASSGSAYVYHRAGTVWTQEKKLTASDAASGDGFGLAVGVSGDLALIGAYVDDLSPGGINAGSAYLFQRNSGAWNQRDKVVALDPGGNDQFGSGVGLDGDTGIIAAPFNDDGGTDSGCAYIFDLIPTNPCDMDADLDADAADVAIFINVLLKLDLLPAHVARADVNCSMTADGDDVTPFVECFIP